MSIKTDERADYRLSVYLLFYLLVVYTKENRLCGEQVVLEAASAATPVLARHSGFYVYQDG